MSVMSIVAVIVYDGFVERYHIIITVGRAGSP